MPTVKRTVEMFVCGRCEHEWLPRQAEGDPSKPRVCAKCHSPYWDVPRRMAAMKKKANIAQRGPANTSGI